MGLLLALSACAHTPAATLAGARRSLCGDLLSFYPGALSSLDTGAGPKVSAFIARLQTDATLFSRAGDPATARVVSTYAEGEQAYYEALVSSPHAVIFLNGSASESQIRALEALL